MATTDEMESADRGPGYGAPSPAEWRRLAPLLDQLLDCEPDQRGALLHRLAESPDVRAVLARMLDECERSAPVLDTPAAARFTTLLDDDSIALPETIAGRYRVVRELGRGGMSVVWQATDLRHSRDVAIKVLRPRVAAMLGSRRFMREIEILAQLRHPHIVPLFDSGEVDGLLYYVMPLEPGQSLRVRLASEGPFAIGDAVRILRDVSGALAYAHRFGVVHRDIKPDNVLLVDRHAMVTDFGVAKALGPASLRLADPSTTGLALGTPAYMAPEQIGADPQVDHRADIYAVGVLAYELLTGRPPFDGATRQEVLAGHLSEQPEPLAARRGDVSPQLSDIVMRCLAKRPDDRWPDADALFRALDALSAAEHSPVSASMVAPSPAGRTRAPSAAALTWSALRARRRAMASAAAAIGVLVLSLVAWLGWRGDRGAAAADEPRVRERFIVAEFTNNTAHANLGALLAQVVGDELAGSPRLAALSPERIAETKRRMRLASDAPLTRDVAREIAAREEVNLVIEGSIQASGRSLVLTARIVEAASGDAIHGATVTAADSTDLPEVVGQLARDLRAGLGESLASIHAQTGPLWSYTTRSLAALEHHMASIRARSVGDHLRAAELNMESIAIDPDFAVARLALASNLSYAGLPTGPAVDGLRRAHELRDSLSARDRDAVDAFYNLFVLGDVPASIVAFQRHLEVLRKYPGERGFTSELAVALDLSGDFHSAETVIAEANALFGGIPSSPNQVVLAQTLFAAGNEHEARHIIDEVLRRVPDHPRFKRLRVGLLASAGQYEEAHEAAIGIRRTSSMLNDLRLQAEIDAVRGRFDEAVAHLRELRDQAAQLGFPGAAIEIAAAAARLRFLAGDSACTREVEDQLARTPPNALPLMARPYLPLAYFYAVVGHPSVARAWLARYERDVPTAWRGPDSWMRHRVLSAVLLAEGAPDAALRELRAGERVVPVRVGMFDEPFVRMSAEPERGRVFVQLGAVDSAIATYERYLAMRWLPRTGVDAFELAPALQELITLHEQRGDSARAAGYRRRLGTLRRMADARYERPGSAAAPQRPVRRERKSGGAGPLPS